MRINATNNTPFQGIMRVRSYEPYDILIKKPYQLEDMVPYEKTVETTKVQDNIFLKAINKVLNENLQENFNDNVWVKLNRNTVKELYKTVSGILKEHNLHSVRTNLAALPISACKNEKGKILIYDDKSMEYEFGERIPRHARGA